MIIRSFEDNDFYNFTMGQMIHDWSSNVEVRFAFKNRTSVPLGKILKIEELQDNIWELAKIIREGPSTPGMFKMRGTELFSSQYLNALQNLDTPDIIVEADGEDLIIEYTGKWLDCIFFETPILAIVNELYGRTQGEAYNSWWKYENLLLKLKTVSDCNLKFMEFGTRRRYSRSWQEKLMEIVADVCPEQLLGTSNLQLAIDFGLNPMGTMAHQLFMVSAALYNDRGLDFVHKLILGLWQLTFTEHRQMLIALTDTYGTDLFLKSFDSHATSWAGVRQDSGNPIEFADKMVKFYSADSNSKGKTLVFSDGLDIIKMRDLARRYSMFFNVVFGWGTNLTNDVGIQPLSIVIKPIAARVPGGEWQKCVKLSDNIAKATGDPEEILKYKILAGYEGTFSERPVY